jgi:2-keto-4-pentenoate hydratase/2-oxohepta-3-ene-1,7-dioic acid hydratase in catechol pathway
MTTIVLDDVVSGGRHVVAVGRVLLAGFTGRRREAVEEHVRELAEAGVPTPDRTPALYETDGQSVRQTAVLVVSADNTSGEIEPVVIMAEGQLLLTIGSDHTDRDLERENIAAAKRACQKVIGPRCVPLSAISDWDRCQLMSWLDDDSSAYQCGTFADLMTFPDILAELRAGYGLELRDGDVLFLGTLPALGGIRPANRFRGRLSIPALAELDLEYHIADNSGLGRSSLRKPELEFGQVDEVAWIPVPGGVAGQTERILAADGDTGVATRMLRFEKGTDTSELGVVRHDFWEEVYILDGDLYDLTLGKEFTAGSYACRPPGMPHGPWRSRAGCVTFEVRYPAS